jgi:hypothetical protein
MSLKDWMKKIESAQLNEFATNGQVQIKPASQMPKAPGQQGQAQPGQPAGANNGQQGQGATNANTQVITQGNKTLGTVNNPQLAQQIKQSIGKGEMTLAGDQLGEDEVSEVITKKTPAGAIIKDFQKSKDSRFKGDSKQERTKRALGAYYSMHPKKSNTEESMMAESKQLNEGSLDEIISNHPHEHKMCQEGWGMDNSLFEALADHYFKEGRIPRSVWHGSAEELREFVESCYAKDTMGTNEDMINSGMLDEQDVTEGYDTEELANEIYAEFERIYPNLARRADERTIHAAIMDVLNYGGDNNPGALAQDVARAVKQQMQQGMLDEDGIISEQDYEDDKKYVIDVQTGEVIDGPFDNTGEIPLRLMGFDGAHKVVSGSELSGMNEGSKEDFTMNARQADPRLDKYATDPKQSFLDKAGSALGSALKKSGSAVMNKLHPSDDQLRSGPLEETK